jgi:hypothetical protein
MLNVDSSGHVLGSPVPLKTSSLVNYDPALSKDGKNAVFAARQSGAWELQLVKLPGGAVTRLSARLPDLREIVFNAKGDAVYYSGQLPGTDRLSDYELALESAVPQTVLERSLGGIWDSSPDDHWLISHGQKLVSAPMGASYDDTRPIRNTLVLVNRTTCEVTPFLFDPDGHLFGEFSGVVRRSETVTLSHPVVPVADSFVGGFIRVCGLELRERNGQLPRLPADLHEHVVLASILVGHT